MGKVAGWDRWRRGDPRLRQRPIDLGLGSRHATTDLLVGGRHDGDRIPLPRSWSDAFEAHVGTAAQARQAAVHSYRLLVFSMRRELRRGPTKARARLAVRLSTLTPIGSLPSTLCRSPGLAPSFPLSWRVPWPHDPFRFSMLQSVSEFGRPRSLVARLSRCRQQEVTNGEGRIQHIR